MFGKEYPHLPGYAKVKLYNLRPERIDEFSDPKKLPQIVYKLQDLAY